jgi:anti-sigma regulatory factor (Ser/Thr protein kinase)
MPLNREPLPLAPAPASVKAARKWVGDLLDELGRDDLVDAAELGVSELVTNAILHGEPPITVRLRGTKDHPRVEVRDRSQSPPEVNIDMGQGDQLLSTIGRGLGIVAIYSTTWGADVLPEGKTVWFEPNNELRVDGDLTGAVFDLAEVVEDLLAGSEEPEEWISIRLLGMPVQAFAHYRTRYDELRRELRLLSLGHGEDYPVARRLTELSLQVDKERRQAAGISALDQAIADGLDRVDLEYDVPPSAPETMSRLLAVLERADEFCRDQRLLTLASTPLQLAVQRWYLTEFVRQGAGAEPLPWPGGYPADPATA